MCLHNTKYSMHAHTHTQIANTVLITIYSKIKKYSQAQEQEELPT